MGRGNIMTLALVMLVVAGMPFMTSGSYALTVGIFAGINALVAIGLCILMGSAGQVSLGQAAFYGIGAYVSSVLSVKFGLPVALSMIAAMAAASFAAVLLAVPALRLKGHYLAVATLGFGEIVNVLLNEWGPGGPSGFGDIPHLTLFGYTLSSTTANFYFIWICVAAVIIFSLNILNSRTGRSLRAIHGSETASIAMGLDIVALKMKVFILSAVYASFAGALYAHYVTFISPSSFNLFYSVLALMMVVLGGITNVWGGLAGAIIITILPELLRKFEEFDVLVYGLILTLSLLFLRKGIVPLLIEKAAKFKGGSGARA